MKKDSKTTKVLLALKEYEDPINTEELITLLQKDNNPWTRQTIHSAINHLIGKGYKIHKTGNKANRKYQYGGQDIKKITSTTPTISTPPITKTIYTPCRESTTVTMLERCYYLVKAGRSISAQRVSDFFDIDIQKAMELMHKVNNKYPNTFNITIRMEVRNDR